MAKQSFENNANRYFLLTWHQVIWREYVLDFLHAVLSCLHRTNFDSNRYPRWPWKFLIVKVSFAIQHPTKSFTTLLCAGILYLQGYSESMQWVDYGKTTHFVPKYSCWLPQGIRGDLDFSHTYHFFTSTCAQWAMKFFKIQNLKLTSLDNKSKQKPLTWLKHFRITIKSCG